MSSESIRFLILASVFGVVGVLSRIFIANFFVQRSTEFPTGTFLINMIGSFLIGFLFFSKTLSNYFSPDVQKAVLVGLLGGFTTFSAVSLESLSLLKAGHYWIGSFYLIGSPVAGLVCAFAGFHCGSRF